MKLLRGCWYSLMAASLLVGCITGRREFFLLLFIMGFVLIFSLCLNVWTARSFCYFQEAEKKVCVKGDQTHMRVEITNDKPFPFSLICVTMLPIARSQVAYERFSLLPDSRIVFTVPLPCPYRGIHSVGIAKLEINDSFGLVKTNYDLIEKPYYRHIEVKVYPQLTELHVLPAAGNDSKQVGNANLWYAEQGESFAGLRPYRPGDPLKRVHRAVSSRLREWYVRTYDLPLETSVLIMLDTTAAFETEEEGLYLGDLVCQCAAAIARYGLKTGHRVIYRDISRASALILKSPGDFPRLNDRLAGLNFESEGGRSVSGGAVSGGAVSGGALSRGAVSGGAVGGGAVGGGAVGGGAVGGRSVSGGAVRDGAVRSGAVSGGAERSGAVGFPQLTKKQLSEAQTTYIISARGSEGIGEVMSRLDTARFNVKLIRAGHKLPGAPYMESRVSLTSGAQTISVIVGDDIASALAM